MVTLDIVIPVDLVREFPIVLGLELVVEVATVEAPATEPDLEGVLEAVEMETAAHP